MKILLAGDLYAPDSASALPTDMVTPLLGNGYDYKIVNLEGPLSQGQGLVPLSKFGPRLQLHQATLSQYFGPNNFNVALLANNHIMDQGTAGLTHTLAQLKSANIRMTGAGLDNSHATEPLILQSGSTSVAIVNIGEATVGVTHPHLTMAGYAWALDPGVYARIAQLKQRYDAILVCVHAGLENAIIPLPQWRAIYRAYIDAGADIVIGAHPHIVQGKEQYMGRWIYYSLGNFCFPKPNMSDDWYTSLMLSLTWDQAHSLAINEHWTYLSEEGIRLMNETQLAKWLPQWHNRCDLLTPTHQETYNAELNRIVTTTWPMLARQYAFFPFRRTIPGRHPFAQRAVNGIRYILGRYPLVAKQNAELLYHNVVVDTNRFLTELAVQPQLP